MLQGLLMLLMLLNHSGLPQLLPHQSNKIVVNLVSRSLCRPFRNFKPQPEDDFFGQHGEDQCFGSSKSNRPE